MKKALIFFLIFTLIFDSFFINTVWAEVNWDAEVCAYDANGNGALELDEYANCGPQLQCPFDHSLSCGESQTTTCNCPSGTTNVNNQQCTATPVCTAGTYNPNTHRCEATPSQQTNQQNGSNCIFDSNNYYLVGTKNNGSFITMVINGQKVINNYYFDNILAPMSLFYVNGWFPDYRELKCNDTITCNRLLGINTFQYSFVRGYGICSGECRFNSQNKYYIWLYHKGSTWGVPDPSIYKIDIYWGGNKVKETTGRHIYIDNYLAPAFAVNPYLLWYQDNILTAVCKIGENHSNPHCGDGWIYDAYNNICYSPPQCPPGTSFDASSDSCVGSPSCTTVTNPASCSRTSDPTCAEPGTLNFNRNICETEPRCNYSESYVISQTFKPNIDSCEIVKQCLDRWECPDGPYAETSCDYAHKCIHYASPVCPSGLSYSSYYNRCQKVANTVYDCSLGGTYSSYSSCSSNCKTRDCWQECHDECTTEGNSTVCNKVCETKCSPWSYGSCTSRKVCDVGSLSGSYCVADASCPGDLTLNTGTDRCEKTGIQCNQFWDCPGYENSVSCDANHQCTIHKPPQCPSSNPNCCPSGYDYTGPDDNRCVSPPQCDQGGTYNSARKRCEVALGDYGNWICDVTEQRYSSQSYCNSQCFNQGACVENVSTHKYICGANNQEYDSYSECQSQCRVQTQCRQIEGSACPENYIYDTELQLCFRTPFCNHDGTLNLNNDRCIITQVSCAGYSQYNYSSSSKKCEANISCHEGHYNSDTQQCIIQEECEEIIGCPFPNGGDCIQFNPDDIIDPFLEENADLNSLENDAEDPTGNCNGQIYIFSGYGSECLLAGVKTGFHNCCDECNDKIKDDISSSMVSLGGMLYRGAQTLYKGVKIAMETYKVYNALKSGQTAAELMHANVSSNIIQACQLAEKAQTGVTGAISNALTGSIKNFVMGFDPTSMLISIAISFVLNKLMETLLAGCNADSIMTACYNELGLCHYVGKYCKKKWPFVGCVQEAKTYCCFNSKLARIVQEQGRQQLSTIGDWGGPKSPECRGFTPEEFQMLDFSRIDLSEWYGDIQTRMQEDIQQKLNENAQQFQQGLNYSGYN